MRIGLTGGIGSGKSTVASMLVSLGATLVDTDAIARHLTGPQGAAMPALRQAFGDSIVAPDGSLDREHMRGLAFADAVARRQLEAVLHPMIGDEARRQAAQAGHGCVVIDVPLLTESSHWRQFVRRILVVDCSEATQIERVSRRPGWTVAMAQQAITAQTTRAARRAIADAVILNDDIALATLQLEAGSLWSLWNNAR